MVKVVGRVDGDRVWGAVDKDTNNIEHAKAGIRYWLDPTLADDDWTEDEIVWCLELLSAKTEPDAEAVSRVIARAVGERWVWDSLQEITGSRLLHGQPLGDALRRWAGEALRGDRTPPRKPPGAPPTTATRNHLMSRLSRSSEMSAA